MADSNPGPAGGDAPAIAAFTDLIFSARIRAAAAEHGTRVFLSTHPDRFLEAVAGSARTAFVDLDSRGADPVALIARLRERMDTRDARIVAFASHVRTDAIAAARTAGADRVLARGAFARTLPRLVRDPLAAEG